MEHYAMENSLGNTPNPEVLADKKRRRKLTAAYKLGILKQADLCRGHEGQLGQLLRREGLYSSQLTDWRRQRDEGTLSIFGRKRGPKPRFSETELKVQKLEKENARLTKKLEQAELIIEVQKKIAQILGNPIESVNNDEDKS